VRAHPEDRAQPNFWTPEERGIFRADLVASGNQEEIRQFQDESLSEVFYVSDTEIMEVWNEGLIFRLTLPDGSLLLADPKVMRGRRELGSYKRERDRYRARSGKPAKWETMSQRIAANFIAKSPSQAQRAAACRIVWDKNWTGYNASKGGLSAACALCGSPTEDQEHVIRGCSHPGMRKVRRLAKEHFNNSISVLRERDLGLSRLIERYREVAYTASGTSLWVGQLTREQATRIGTGRNMNDEQWSGLLKALLPIFEGTLAIYGERKRLLKDNLLTAWEKEAVGQPGRMRSRTLKEKAWLRDARLNRMNDAHVGHQTVITRWYPVVARKVATG
jgi:hypothetical protein